MRTLLPPTRYRSQVGVAIATFYRASPRLTIATLTVATLFGLLQPSFVIATGALVQAATTGGSVVLPLALLAVIFGVTRVMGPLRDELGLVLWRRVDQSVGDRIMRAMSRQPGLEQVEDPHVQDLVAQAEGTLTGDSIGQAAQMLPMLWSQRVYAVASLGIVARTYWWAALLLLAIHTLGYSAARWHWFEVTIVLLERTDRMRRSFYVRGLALSSKIAKETRVFGLSRWLVDRYRSSALAVLHDVWNKRQEGWLLGVSLALLMSGAEALVIWTVTTDSLAARVAIGTAVATVQAIFAVGFLSNYQDPDWAITQAATSAERVQALERAAPATRAARSGDRDPAGMPRHAIRFEHVAFTYPHSARVIFDDFNLTVEAGTSLAIVGENGAGKTTLVKLLARLYDPTRGQITIDGVDVRDLDPAAWHRRIAAVFQDFAQFELSAYDNVAFGALHVQDDQDGVHRAALHAGAAELVGRLPHGWATLLSRELSHGSQLSGGEWQRLALARALFAVSSGAGILILDEPTASLDVRGESEVYQRFLELTSGVTTIVISHRFSTVRRADRIVVIEHGQVVESGSHSDLMDVQNGRYADMYMLQAARFLSPDASVS